MSHYKPADDKGQSLRRTGTLNTKADKVQDELFQTDAFFDACDLVQVKYEMLRRVERDGWSIKCAAERFGFSRPTFYQAREAFEEKGLWGLVSKRRGPKGSRKLTAEMIEAVEALRKTDPSLSWKTLADEVFLRYGRRMHPRTIQRCCTARKKNGKRDG